MGHKLGSGVSGGSTRQEFLTPTMFSGWEHKLGSAVTGSMQLREDLYTPTTLPRQITNLVAELKYVRGSEKTSAQRQHFSGKFTSLMVKLSGHTTLRKDLLTMTTLLLLLLGLLCLQSLFIPLPGLDFTTTTLHRRNTSSAVGFPVTCNTNKAFGSTGHHFAPVLCLHLLPVSPPPLRLFLLLLNPQSLLWLPSPSLSFSLSAPLSPFLPLSLSHTRLVWFPVLARGPLLPHIGTHYAAWTDVILVLA